MKRINSKLAFVVLSMVFGSFCYLTNNTKTIKTSGETTTMSAQTYLKNIWNNDGAKVSTTAFDYNVGWGSLSTGAADGTHGFHAFTKDTSTEGNFTSGSQASVDWGAARFTSLVDERVMLVIKAKKGLTVKTSFTGLAGGKDDTILNYYVLTGDINNSTWYQSQSDGLVKSVEMNSTTATNAGYTATLTEGQTLVFEWGFQWDGWLRTLEFVNSGLTFEFTEAVPTPVNNVKVLKLGTMNDTMTYTSGEEDNYQVAPFASYGIYHGSVANGQIVKYTNISTDPRQMTSDNTTVRNWRTDFGNGDNYIVKITAAEKLLLTVSREALGSEFLKDSTLNMYKNNELVKTVTFATEPTDTTAFDCVKVLNAGDTFIMELAFEYDMRCIAMKDGGSIDTTLPQFKGEGFANAASNLHPTHSLATIESKAATCTEDGHNAYYKCSVCDECFADSLGTTPIENLSTWLTGAGKIPAQGHKTTEIPQQDSTCTEDGHYHYYQCSVCKNYFEDALGATPINDLSAWLTGTGKIPAINHNYGKPVVEWSKDYECTVTVTCGNDPKHIITQTVKGVYTIINDSTCEEEGTAKYVATFTVEGLPATQESSIITIPVKGHSYGEWTITIAPTEEADGQRTRSCGRCPKVETQVVPKLSEKDYEKKVIVEATKDNEGQIKYTSSEYGTYLVTVPRLQDEPTSSNPSSSAGSSDPWIDVDNKKGCTGSIIATSGLVAIFSLVGIGLVIRKKHE